MTLLLVLLGGGLGAVGRLLIDHLVTARLGPVWAARPGKRPLPLGTLLVNVTGSALLGVLAGTAGGLPGWVYPLLGTGFCGALTTWSTFGYEALRLARDEPAGRRRAVLYVTATLATGLAAVAVGWALGTRL